MDKGVLAGRTNAATDRAQEAATAVVKALDLDPELAAGVKAYYKKDKGITLLRRMEGIADLLEAIVPALTPQNGAEANGAAGKAPKGDKPAARSSKGKKAS